MSLRIINNKRIELTEDEFKYYQEICKSYPSGKELFNDLFETDENGLITFLRPPQKNFSMEIIIYLQNVMLHQHVRAMYSENNKALKDLINRVAALEKKLG